MRPEPTAVGRRVLALAIVGLVAASATVWSTAYRSFEATVAATLQSPFITTRLYRTAWHVNHGRAGAWFVVSAVCTSSVLLIPLAVVGAAAMLAPMVRVRVTLAGSVAGATLVVALNSVRLAVIGLAWSAWGGPSLWITHDVVGTVISLGAMAAGVGIQLSITGRANRRPPRAFDTEPEGVT